VVRYLTLSTIQVLRAYLVQIVSISGCAVRVPVSDPGTMRVRGGIRGLQGAGLWLRKCLLLLWGCIRQCLSVVHWCQGPGDSTATSLVDKEVLKVIDNVSHHRISKLCLRGDEQVLRVENRLVTFVDVV
jgi:hypothetical protein